MYGRTGNEDFSPLVPGTKEYKQAKNARNEMLEGFVFVQRVREQRNAGQLRKLAGNVRRKQA